MDIDIKILSVIYLLYCIIEEINTNYYCFGLIVSGENAVVSGKCKAGKDSSVVSSKFFKTKATFLCCIIS